MIRLSEELMFLKSRKLCPFCFILASNKTIFYLHRVYTWNILKEECISQVPPRPGVLWLLVSLAWLTQSPGLRARKGRPQRHWPPSTGCPIPSLPDSMFNKDSSEYNWLPVSFFYGDKVCWSSETKYCVHITSIARCRLTSQHSVLLNAYYVLRHCFRHWGLGMTKQTNTHKKQPP